MNFTTRDTLRDFTEIRAFKIEKDVTPENHVTSNETPSPLSKKCMNFEFHLCFLS